MVPTGAGSGQNRAMDGCGDGSCGTPDLRALPIAPDTEAGAAIAAALEARGVPVLQGDGPGEGRVALWVSADRYEEALGVLVGESGA